MIKKVKTIKEVTYKGHVIRKVEDVFGCYHILIDNPNDEIETAPAYMEVYDFPYASFADAKRNINGERMLYVDADVFYYRGDEYLNRFKKIFKIIKAKV